MPLNKLENFISNVEGRILYVNPNDLDSTDSITNQGNSLTKPFKTIQRALLESARFSYLRGNDNDITEKTTILLFPGEHVIDNRPGFAIKNLGGTATAVSPTGDQVAAVSELSLTLTSNFDLTSNNNILYKFNSIYGGVVVPRGTSIVGLDLRKTKIRPKYVPNPTDETIPSSSIFRITGACYFWQFSIFDANELETVYVSNTNFAVDKQAIPTFSHHKLTCFEYCDGVNKPQGYDITDLDMYYSKVSNAYNLATGRDIDQKYPQSTLGFAKQRPEWEIVGAFATDPVNISRIISGDGFTPGPIITVTTSTPHELTAGTPIKINRVDVEDYNVSTKVANVLSPTQFTYLIPFVREELPASPSVSTATVTIETDTVSGASPYIFNISLRSVWGMNGMHADGSRASGFRSMVVAQFTAVSLQKDDRAFVKYNQSSRQYESITLVPTYGSELSTQSSSTKASSAYHLDSEAIYRRGWETTHIKISNDAFIQVVSVFAIGFTKHFEGLSGADASITNSNSNFGQLSLASTGFKKEAFAKDDHAYITSIITPRTIEETESNFDWISLDVGLINNVGLSSHLYLFGFGNRDNPPPTIVQGYRVGARYNDQLYVNLNGTVYSAPILMSDNTLGIGVNTILGRDSAEKVYQVIGSPSNNTFTLTTNHELQTGEKVLIISGDGDYPENLTPHSIYYAINVGPNRIRLSSSQTNANNNTALTVYGGTDLKIISRVSDKNAGDIGSPIQFDPSVSNWFIHSIHNNSIYNTIRSLGVGSLSERTNVTFIKRFDDSRSLDERLYKIRVVIPKEIFNAKNPEEAFIIQESSSTGLRSNADFNLSIIDDKDYEYNRNPRFITNCSYTSGNNLVTVTTDLPHNLKKDNEVLIKNVVSNTNPSAIDNIGYNGIFSVNTVPNAYTFTYFAVDLAGITHIPGTFANNTDLRNSDLPRFQKYNIKTNYYIYKNDAISPYIFNVQDGVYHLYVLNSSNKITTEFTDYEYKQNIVDLYPQLDKDNINDNPSSARTFAKRSPIGDITTNDLKKSISRETLDKFAIDFGFGIPITGISTTYSTPIRGTATLTVEREHGLNGIVTYTSLFSGSGYNNGTYYNVPILDFGTTNWRGARATVGISGGQVTSVDITHGGSGYISGNRLEFDRTRIGFGVGAEIRIDNTCISNSVGNSLQVTGIGTTAGGQYLILSVPSKNQVTIGVTAGDPRIIAGEYIINSGRSAEVSSSTYNSSTETSTFTTVIAHGLDVGNKIKIINNDYSNLGNYVVNQVGGARTFSVITKQELSAPRHILKYTLSANDGSSDSSNENLASRASYIYDNEVCTLVAGITTETRFPISVVNSGIATTKRFSLGSYIQVGEEIMRITSSTLSGSDLNEIRVIRGSLGSVRKDHLAGTLVKKIKLLPIEFRRPSIIRASAHTFEYLGYGPGNYSTGLPQVQVKTLTEREEFLSQAQEKSAGVIVYTGMNNRGDVYTGNTKTSASSGQVTSYNIPKPTVTGSDPSRLSVTFDEIIVKERILVEGGNSGTLLSQFDGPVTFNRDVKINSNTTINADLKTTGIVNLTNTTQSTAITNGALIVAGGVGVGKNLNIGGNLTIAGVTTIANATTLNGILTVNGATSINNTLFVSNRTTLGNTLTVSAGSTFRGNINNWNTTTPGLSVGGVHLGNSSGTTNAGPAITFGARDSSSGETAQAGIYINSNGTYGTRLYLGTTDNYSTGSKVGLSIDEFGNVNIPRASLIVNQNIRAGIITATNTLTTPSLESTSFLRVGNAYLSSGGDFTHLANNEWYNGSQWISNGISGSLYQQSGQTHNWYRHNGQGTNTLLMSLNSSANLTVQGGLTIGGAITANGDITAFFTSDQRLKDNISPIADALSKVKQISGNTFDWNKNSGKEGKDVGVIAQEILEILPEAVVTRDNGYLAVRYEGLIPLLIESIKELTNKVELLETKLNDK
jgi:hypothetical protein